MNKRGIALIMSFLVVVVLTIVFSSFYFKAVIENDSVRRYVARTQAFWLAEAGIAQGINNLPGTSTSGTIGGSGYRYSATATALPDNYYQVDSTGSVSFLAGTSITKNLRAIVKTGEVHPEKFQFAIETTTDLVIKGSVDINPSDSKKEYATLDFADMFGYTKTELKDNATHLYTPSTFAAPVDGITWVDVPAGNTLTIAGNLAGSGILIISGDAHFAGTVDFNGIIYVIGELTITGSVTANGSVLAESSTTVDTEIKGNVTLNYDPTQIAAALNNILFLTKNVVSWRET